MVEQKNPAALIPLFISLILHGIILSAFPLFRYLPQKKKIPRFEVTYQSHSGIKSNKDRGGVSREFLSQQVNVPQKPLPETINQNDQLIKLDLSKLFAHRETIAVPKPKVNMPAPKKQKISLKDLPAEMSKDPAYLGYLDIIRKKIQDAVYYFSDKYFFFNNPQQGKVFVSFIVESNGTLKEVYLHKEKSSSNALLQKIALMAVEEASPFEKFPQELNYNERAFNLEISFEIE